MVKDCRPNVMQRRPKGGNAPKAYKGSKASVKKPMKTNYGKRGR